MAAAKICTICGDDCSDRPRIKDDSGKYACRDCYEQRRAAAGQADELTETKVDLDAMDDEPAEASARAALKSRRPPERRPVERDEGAADRSHASGTRATLSDTQSASFHDLDALLGDDAEDVCPRCGKLVSRRDDECRNCGARLADFQASTNLDRLTEMGFLFSEDGAWHHGARIILGIYAVLAVGAAFMSGCAYASVALIAMMAAIGWLWSVYAAWRAKHTPWAAGLVVAYPLVVPGLFHAYAVTKNKRLRTYHTMLLACAALAGAAYGMSVARERNVFSDMLAGMGLGAAEKTDGAGTP